MKTKRFLSLLLALVMSFSMAVPAFAADDPDDPDAGIMPLATIFDDKTVNAQSGTYQTYDFTSTPGYGKYIKVWYANRSDYDAVVKLYVRGQTGSVRTLTVKANDYYQDNVIWYEIPDTAPVTFYVLIEGVNHYAVVGYLSVRQTEDKSA